MDEQTALLLALALLTAAGLVVGVVGVALFRRTKGGTDEPPADGDESAGNEEETEG